MAQLIKSIPIDASWQMDEILLLHVFMISDFACIQRLNTKEPFLYCWIHMMSVLGHYIRGVLKLEKKLPFSRLPENGCK